MIPASNDLLLASADEGYNLTRSLRTRSSASAFLSRTPASAGNRKTWTWSAWVKRGALGTRQVLFSCNAAGNDNQRFLIEFGNSSDDLSLTAFSQVWRTTTQVFRDPSAWYHIVVNIDTTQATASNRIKLYITVRYGLMNALLHLNNDFLQCIIYSFFTKLLSLLLFR